MSVTHPVGTRVETKHGKGTIRKIDTSDKTPSYIVTHDHDDPKLAVTINMRKKHVKKLEENIEQFKTMLNTKMSSVLDKNKKEMAKKLLKLTNQEEGSAGDDSLEEMSGLQVGLNARKRKVDSVSPEQAEKSKASLEARLKRARDTIAARGDKLDEMCCDDCDEDEEEELEETDLTEARRTVIKVNARGKRRRKIMCGRGKKLVGTTCKPISGKEKQVKRLAVRKAKRTLKRKGSGARRRSVRLRARAMMKRKSMGLKRRRR